MNWIIGRQKVKKIGNCYDQLEQSDIFFIEADLQLISPDKKVSFIEDNKICQFQLLDNNLLNHYINLWNQKKREYRNSKNFINQTKLEKYQKRLLSIWLRLYFDAGIYIHAQFGVNFGTLIDQRYLINAKAGKQLIFAKASKRNEKGIFLPEEYFKTVKVGTPYSQYVQKIIKAIIAQQDWLKIFQSYQCIIFRKGLKTFEDFDIL